MSIDLCTGRSIRGVPITILTAESVLTRLRKLADKNHQKRMSGFGINHKRALGVSVPKIRGLAKEIGTDHKLAQELWKSKIHEARILAPMLADPEQVTSRLLDQWVEQIDSWDICDGFCGNLVDKTAFAQAKVPQWAARDQEFVRRAAFATIAYLAVHDKSAKDEVFECFFPLIISCSDDQRNFVIKAVNWALRQIGKRNSALNERAIEVALAIKAKGDSSSRWMAADALRELKSAAVKAALKRKAKLV